MGLAPYGEPRLLAAMRTIVRDGPGGGFSLDPECFDFLTGPRMFSEALAERLGGPPRVAGAELTAFHHDVARSAQARLEEVLLDKVRYLHGAGALAAPVPGGRRRAQLRGQRPPPARGAVRAPVRAARRGRRGGGSGRRRPRPARAHGRRPISQALEHVYWGPRFSSDAVAEQVAALELDALDFRGREAALLEATVDRLAAGRVVAWFHGAMEFGPRALGARSILADPRVPDMRDRVNRLVKHREAFRPFAPSVLRAHAAEHFELDHASPFMLQTCRVRSPLALPAITHVDGSARPQTVDAAHAPRYAALLTAFARRTGCPLLLNTSFNVHDEPIVRSPADALACLAGTEIDSLVLEDFVIDRSALPEALVTLAARRASIRARERAISAELYTFV